jgi:transcriptional regulator with XRE-family HTH domain
VRLRQWRKSLPLKSYQLAKLIMISQGSLSDIENFKSFSLADTIVKLYQYTNLNIIWLFTGKGPTQKTQHVHGEEPAVIEELESYGVDLNFRN